MLGMLQGKHHRIQPQETWWHWAEATPPCLIDGVRSIDSWVVLSQMLVIRVIQKNDYNLVGATVDVRNPSPVIPVDG